MEQPASGQAAGQAIGVPYKPYKQRTVRSMGYVLDSVYEAEDAHAA